MKINYKVINMKNLNIEFEPEIEITVKIDEIGIVNVKNGSLSIEIYDDDKIFLVDADKIEK